MLLARLDTDIEDIAPAKNDVAVVGCWGIAPVLGRPFQDYVHVAVSVDHATTVLHIVLETNGYFGVELFDQQVERFLGWFHARITDVIRSFHSLR